MARMAPTKGLHVTPELQPCPLHLLPINHRRGTTTSGTIFKPTWSIRAPVAAAQHVVNVGSSVTKAAQHAETA